MSVSESELVARVERDRQDARVQRLVDALKSMAGRGIDKPADTISAEDADRAYNRQEAWHDGHEAGVETGWWLAGNEAQDALDDWDASA